MSQHERPLKDTPLRDRHDALGAKIGPFAGYAMPIMYRGIADEHTAVRTAAGLFDVSHMGRLIFEGSAGDAALERLVAVHVSNVPVGRARYGFVLTETGGVLDDVILYALSETTRLLVVNAGNRRAVLEHFRSLDVDHASMADETEGTAMLALQGPTTREMLRRVMPEMEPPGPSQRAMTGSWNGVPLVLATTGYTGEDGVELIVPAEAGAALWDRLVEAGATPAGLGARDTLRLEVGYPLHGHELTTETTPWQARLAWALDLKNASFFGREGVLARKAEQADVLVGMRSEGRGVPRAEQTVLHDGEPVGAVTSGTFSPSLRRGIALAYVNPGCARVGLPMIVVSSGARTREAPMEIAPVPFYRDGSRRSSRG